MRRINLNLVVTIFLFAAVNFSCLTDKGKVADLHKLGQEQRENAAAAAKIGVDRQRGVKIVYYKIQAAISNEELIKTAAALHKKEPDAQIILVDDDSQAVEYIRYVNEIGAGIAKTKMPKEWADKHIVANVQKHVNGKFVLCLGRGFQEIAELE